MKHLLQNIFRKRYVYKSKKFQLYVFLQLAFILTIANTVHSQNVLKPNLGNFVGVPAGISFNEILDPQWLANNADKNFLKNSNSGIKGSPYFNDEPAEGFILFKNQKLAKDVKLRYNLFDNSLYFLSDGKELVLSNMNEVSQFGIFNKDENRFNIFRNGFPPYDKNSSATFYAYTSPGKITLLRLFNKSLMQTTNALGAPEKKFINGETWFIYNSENFYMVEIKRNKNALKKALPDFAVKIEDVIREKKLNLKNYNDWEVLILALNY